MTQKTPQNQAPSFSDCLISDRATLRTYARQLRQLYGEKKEAAETAFQTLLARSQAAVKARKNALPSPVFDEALPINQKRDEIAALIEQNQVIIVCGETGSGKTTQLPKICLALGRGVTGKIGHTQPRRLAARATASRIAFELSSEMGHQVGYKVRFTDKTSPNAYIKLMTDGILLAQTQSDPFLSEYDTLIIDEAHERTLNIDFLLGYLHKLLKRRPDLKLIITSATLDSERFAEHFAMDGKPAPVIEVSGRLYPVEIRYRPIQNLEAENEEERDLYDAIVDACDELRQKDAHLARGDILVLLPGEREIKEAQTALLRAPQKPHDPIEIVPLFARLPLEAQARVFQKSTARKIVLATNVAETSLTVPGIRYVVDTGQVRMKRYSYRNKLEQLQIEKNAQASAKQRAGRCGRVANGICIRLYDEADFEARPMFADPEILRSSLAGVILQMSALHLGDIEAFPFLNPPPEKAIKDAYQTLFELQAMDEKKILTPTGKLLAKFPTDPKIARMIVGAHETGAMTEVLIIAAALSTQDPKERPPEKAGSADAAHKRFSDEKSEFVSFLKLWDWYQSMLTEGDEKKSDRKIAKECHAQFLSAQRMKEWRETHAQLQHLAKVQGFRENQIPASYEAIHTALLTGLLSNLGMKSPDKNEYLGARGIKFLLHPGSSFAKKSAKAAEKAPMKWLMAAEISETSRLFARTIAKIEPEWAETAAHALLKKSYFEPHFEKKAMQAVIFERSSLYGLVLQAKKRVSLASIDAAQAREIFIKEALVAGEVTPEYEKRWAFFRHNHALCLEIERLEHKSRRQDVLVDDDLIFAFYDDHLPKDVFDAASLNHFLKNGEEALKEQLFLQKEDLMRHEAAGITTDAFPPSLQLGMHRFALSYHFEPGSDEDGVTLTLPLAHLNQIPEAPCDWLVPGLLKEKVAALAKTLPQKIRSKIIPMPDFVDDFVAHAAAKPEVKTMPLIAALVAFIQKEKGLDARGMPVFPEAFREDALAPHFFFRFVLENEEGRFLAQSRNLSTLKAQFGKDAKAEFGKEMDAPSEFQKLTHWGFGQLSEIMEVSVPHGKDIQKLVGFQGLKDEETAVSLALFDTPEEAEASHQKGLLRLFMLQFPEQTKYLAKNLPGFLTLAMLFMAHGTAEELKSDLITLTFARATMHAPLPNNEAAFQKRCEEARPRLGLLAQEIARLATEILEEAQKVKKRLPQIKAHKEALDDIDAQLSTLLPKGFLVKTPFLRLKHFPRYLKGISLRLDKLKNDAQKDRRQMDLFLPIYLPFTKKQRELAKRGYQTEAISEFRWQLEELRVALFAQELKTPSPVSAKRLQKLWESIR